MMVWCFNDYWMRNMIYDGFVSRWPLIANMILSLYDSKFNKLEAWYCVFFNRLMLNLIFEIWWSNIRKVWLILYHDTLDAKYDDTWMRHMIYDDFWWHLLCLDDIECAIWYMIVLWLDDPLMRKMIYYGFVTRCFLNEKYDIWWLCTSMTLECEIW
jgi:hypothetical protein